MEYFMVSNHQMEEETLRYVVEDPTNSPFSSTTYLLTMKSKYKILAYKDLITIRLVLE